VEMKRGRPRRQTSLKNQPGRIGQRERIRSGPVGAGGRARD
jgi:hypothetical protein